MGASDSGPPTVGAPRWYGLPDPALPELFRYERRALPGEAKVHGLPEGHRVILRGQAYTRDTSGAVTIPASALPVGGAVVADAEGRVVARLGALFDRSQYGWDEEGELTESEVVGYGYYGNYASGFFGGTPDIEFEAQDAVFTDTASSQIRGREFLGQDRVGMAYGRVSRYGEIFKEASDAVRTSDQAPPRGGRFFKDGADSLRLTDSGRQSGKRAFYGIEPALFLNDNRPWHRAGLRAHVGFDRMYLLTDQPRLQQAHLRGRDSLAVADTWRQGGKRNHLRPDGARLETTSLRTGTLAKPPEGDSSRVGESWTLHVARQHVRRTDGVRMDELYGRHGRWAFPGSRDTFEVADSRRPLAGRQNFRGSDSVGVAGAHRVNGRRRWAFADEVAAQDTGYQRGGLRVHRFRDGVNMFEVSRGLYPLERDGATLSAYAHTPWREMTRREAVGVRDSRVLNTWNFTRSEAVRAAAHGEAHGKRAQRASDAVRWNGAGQMVNLRPRRADAVKLTAAYRLSSLYPSAFDRTYVQDEGTQHGRRNWTVQEQVGADLAVRSIHGRRAWRLRETVYVREGRIDPERQVLGSDRVGVADATDHKGASDRVYLVDGQVFEERVDPVGVRERAWKVRVNPKAKDTLSVRDRRHVISDRRAALAFGVRDRRILETPRQAVDGAGVRESHRLLRARDFLHPVPDEYLERPGRRRFALRVNRQPSGFLIAAWLERGQVKVARARREGDWNGASVTATAAPPGARQISVAPDGTVVTGDGRTLRRGGEVWDGADPCHLGDALYWLSPDRLTLHGPAGPTPLPRRGYLRQTFTRDGSGLVVLDDLERPLVELGARYVDQQLDTASARWLTRTGLGAVIPIEGDVRDPE